MRLVKRIGFIILYLFAFLAIAFVVFVPIHIPWLADGGDNTKEKVIIAHRGACGVAPENTLPAIDSALAAEADWIEIDVHLSKDHRVVVIHDLSVDRTTNGSGRVSEMDWEEIKELDAGCKFEGDYEGVRVPLLEEVIQHVNAKAKLLIEIKKGKGSIDGIEEKVAELIIKNQAEEWCMIQSFSDRTLEKLSRHWPEIEIHKLFVFKFRFIPFVFDGGINSFSFDKYEKVEAFNFHRRFTYATFLDKVHSNGKKANAWGCRSRGACKTGSMGQWDGLITDYPGDYR